MDIVKKLQQSLARRLDKTQRYLIACSGGADSLALTDALAALHYEIWVCHVEHGLRGAEGLRDAAFVEKFCQERQLPFLCRHVDVAGYCQQEHLSVEDGARRLRYQALTACADLVQAAFILTAHQKDDQAETFLLHLLRGAATNGLGAMAEQRSSLLRPLLPFTAEQLRDYCQQRQLSWCEDSTNTDLHFSRNKVRHLLLPLLRSSFNPNIVETLERTAACLRTDELYLSREAAKLWQSILISCRPLELVCDGVLLSKAAVALQGRVLRLAWHKLAPGVELGFVHVEALQRLCRLAQSGKTLMLPGGYEACYLYGKLLLRTQGTAGAAGALRTYFFSWEELAPGLRVTAGAWEVEISCQAVAPKPNAFCLVYPWTLAEQLGGGLSLRARQAGDRFAPYRGCGRKKLQDYFVNKKIPWEQRDQLYLVTAGKEVLGIPGLEAARWPQAAAAGFTKWLVIKVSKGWYDDEQGH